MTAEQKPERSLVVRSKQSSIKEISDNPLLRVAGFSPNLPALLGDLNESLTQIGVAAYISGVKIKMFTGKIPQIETNIEYRGYTVEVTSHSTDYGMKAELFVRSTQGSGQLWLPLKDLQGFFASTFPDKKAVVKGIPSKHLLEPEEFEHNVKEVTQEMLDPLTDDKPAKEEEYATSQKEKLITRAFSKGIVVLEGKENPIFAFYFWDVDKESGKKVIFMLDYISFEDTPSEVERIIGAIAQLFNKSVWDYRSAVGYSDKI